MWYLVAFLKTLPQDGGELIAPYQTIDDLDWEDQSALPKEITEKYLKIGKDKESGNYKPNPGGPTAGTGGAH